MNELESELKKISDQISTTAKALRVIQKTAEEDAFALKKLRQKIEKAETEEEKAQIEEEKKKLESEIEAKQASTLTLTLVEAKNIASEITLTCSGDDYALSSTPVTIPSIDKSSAVLTLKAEGLTSADLDAEPLCAGEKQEEIALIRDGETVPEGFAVIKFEYTKGGDGEKKELIEKYNELGRQRDTVITSMRAVAQVSPSRAAAGGNGGGAVKAGFLNAKKKDQGPLAKISARWQAFSPWFWRLKNPVLFAVVVGGMAMFGDELAVPVPVV
ncbi:hypothetical protein TrST_g7973 [Triparma strigata]|uniref:Uncharacterized protein n=1 Tax=Triparma strigata TaxID=1606541 RepID=A0A9W7AWQ5_9STRA|nr:hypothetical protein TrST_g7973 [Triparma strigata]